MSLFKTRPFNTDISSKRLNKELNFKFDRGWSPIIIPYTYDDRVVMKLSDWIGGEGDVPIPLTQDYYLGESGLVTDPNNAVNIAEGYLSSDLASNIIKSNAVFFSLVVAAGGNEDLMQLYFRYNTLNDETVTHIQPLLHRESAFYSGNELNVSYGVTLGGIRLMLKQLVDNLVIDDPLLSEKSIDRVASQRSVYEAIENAKGKFDVPIIDLNSDKIAEVQSMSGLSNTNPYYAMVGSDNRTNGIHSAVCTTPDVCGCDGDGGYEEMGHTNGITGCVCVEETAEVNATCHVIVASLGVEGDTHTIVVNGMPIMWYTVEVGDTISDVVTGLIGSLPSVCGGGSPTCNVANISTDSFDLIAVSGLGAEPNSWTKIYSASGTADGSIILTVPGVNYVPATYRGVEGHLIGYDGNQWYDFGGALGTDSETITTVTIPNVGIKYYINSYDEVTVPDYHQYIVHNNLIVDGVFTLEDNAELIIINN